MKDIFQKLLLSPHLILLHEHIKLDSPNIFIFSFSSISFFLLCYIRLLHVSHCNYQI